MFSGLTNGITQRRGNIKLFYYHQGMRVLKDFCGFSDLLCLRIFSRFPQRNPQKSATKNKLVTPSNHMNFNIVKVISAVECKLFRIETGKLY